MFYYRMITINLDLIFDFKQLKNLEDLNFISIFHR